jgi:DnaJ-class molecular chaperone
MKNANAKVWCRDCGKEMKQYPYDILAFSCKKCNLKATVEYEKMPILSAIKMKDTIPICPHCLGTGTLRPVYLDGEDEDCPYCKGDGKLRGVEP